MKRRQVALQRRTPRGTLKADTAAMLQVSLSRSPDTGEALMLVQPRRCPEASGQSPLTDGDIELQDLPRNALSEAPATVAQWR